MRNQNISRTPEEANGV